MANVTAVGVDTFEKEVLKSSDPVLVDFWAPWCRPCRALAPVLEQVAERFAGQLRVVKVDVDQNTLLAQRYQVQGIPNLVLFRDGQVVAQVVGQVSEAALTQKVTEVLGAPVGSN